MTIDDIFNRILLRSGQYILSKSKIEIDVDSFRILVEDALSDYSGAVPFTREYTLDLNSIRNVVLDETLDTDLGVAPDWLSEVSPIHSFGSITTVLTGSRGFAESAEPIQAPWDYNKHTQKLTVSRPSWYKVIAVYEHFIKLDTALDGSSSYSCPTISMKDQPFFDILRGMFLIGIGRSRRAFTLSDLPILMDADTLVSDGEQLLEKAKQSMLDDQKFYLAYD